MHLWKDAKKIGQGPPSRYYCSGYDVGGYIVGDVMLDDIGEVVSPIAGLSIISVSWSEHQLCNG